VRDWGLSTPVHRQSRLPTVFVYDGYPGSVGISRRGYDAFESLARDTLGVISRCPCERGCPACIQSPKGGNWNEPLNKEGAVSFLRYLLDQTSATRPFSQSYARPATLARGTGGGRVPLEKIVLGPERLLLMSPEERERIAYHEGGHAILGLVVPGADPVNRVTIAPRGQALGVTYQRPEEDRYNYPEGYLRGGSSASWEDAARRR
jgi:hypothetical protein